MPLGIIFFPKWCLCGKDSTAKPVFLSSFLLLMQWLLFVIVINIKFIVIIMFCKLIDISQLVLSVFILLRSQQTCTM